MKNLSYKIIFLGFLSLPSASYSYPVEYSPASGALTDTPTEGVGKPEDDLVALLGMKVIDGTCFDEMDFSGSSVRISLPTYATQIKGVQLSINDEYRRSDLNKEAHYVSFDIYEKIDFTGDVKMMCDVYLNKDIVWIQVYNIDPMEKNNNQDAVESTVFFTGVPDQFYYHLREQYYPVRFTNYSKFKSKVQEKYANKYNPDYAGTVNYRRRVKSSAFNFVD